MFMEPLVFVSHYSEGSWDFANAQLKLVALNQKLLCQWQPILFAHRYGKTKETRDSGTTDVGSHTSEIPEFTL